MNVRILTYNIYGMPWGTKQIHEILLWLFCFSGADIICLQEVFSKKHREIIQDKAEYAHWSVYFPEDACWAGRYLDAYHSGSGLCILVKPTIHVTRALPFVPYTACDSWIEQAVCKGYFGIQFRTESGKEYIVYNTHMVSDFTECYPLRIAHTHSRRFQEKQLLDAVKYSHCDAIIAGDFNQEEFHYFQKMYEDEGWTYRTSQEQIDHFACLHSQVFHVKKVTFFHKIVYSDHIPLAMDLKLL